MVHLFTRQHTRPGRSRRSGCWLALAESDVGGCEPQRRLTRRTGDTVLSIKPDDDGLLPYCAMLALIDRLTGLRKRSCFDALRLATVAWFFQAPATVSTARLLLGLLAFYTAVAIHP